ncbi:RHS repeat-associated core domain-containing protein [Chryseobacterium capnotolerans]|uniref:RHS repeat-associated core domain-containing protein n=1 Tax=Chryseobacterium capnotolerans TaxID=2759528 RepID=UPI003211C044|nr:RHS repeat-associated core domain-containing protein [Chryseobacterium capnotolerans]
MKNSVGVLEVADTNNYYPFGLNHIRNNDFGTSNSGSFYSYKYNGKELQETGMYDYGARMYMPDLGRWGVVDAYAEIMRRHSPYNYAFNNPINFIDPDGNSPRKTYGEHSAFNGDYDPNSSLSGYNGMGNSLGMYFANDGGGSFGWERKTFDETQAYRDIMTAYYNGGTAEFVNNNGTWKWWTDYTDPDSGVTGVGTLNMLKRTSGLNSDNKIDFAKTLSSTSWWGNTLIGAGATANIPRSGFFKYNELWHQTKTRGTSFAWQNKWKNPGAKYWRGQQVKGFQGARNLGTKLTVAGGVLLAADIAMSGEVKASHYINGIMLGASTTGVGSIVAGVWFVADMGTGAVNYLNGNGFKTLSDVIDESSVGQSISFEMYDGLY